MSREVLKSMIDLIDDEDIEIISRVVVKFIPEVKPEPGELEEILEGRRDRAEHGTVPHEEINWD